MHRPFALLAIVAFLTVAVLQLGASPAGKLLSDGANAAALEAGIELELPPKSWTWLTLESSS